MSINHSYISNNYANIDVQFLVLKMAEIWVDSCGKPLIEDYKLKVPTTVRVRALS
jgi:hypothetical protein